MESNEIIQTELNQTTTDLLLQESIQTNQKLEELQNLLISIKDMKSILPESIKNVMFEQLKKQQDSQENSLKQNREELQKSKEQHNLQLNEMKSMFVNKIETFQKETEGLLNKLVNENQKDTISANKRLFENAEKQIVDAVESTTSNFKKASKLAERMIGKNLLFNFVCALVLLCVGIAGCLYVQSYRDGTKIAETKAVEALVKEREKLDNELAFKKKQIELNAIASYKHSDSYREDACKLVASNIGRTDCLHYMYIYIKSDDINRYPEVKRFYTDFLKRGHKQYKKNN